MITNDPISRSVELNAAQDGKITTVTLYPYQADVTRTFHCQLDSGLTRVKVVTGFPSSYDETRLRIKVGESVILGDVKTTWAKADSETNYDRIDTLYEKKSLLQKALARCKRMITALDNYAQTALDKEGRMSPLDVGRFMDSYEEAGAKWDSKVEKLEKEIREIEDKIDEEENSDAPSDASDGPKYSRASVSFSLTSETPRSVDINITYGVSGASWYAGYDLLASSNDDKKNHGHLQGDCYEQHWRVVFLQSWTDVDLKLGSVAPLVAAKLQPWKLAFQNAPNTDPNALSGWAAPKVLTNAEVALAEKTTFCNQTRGQSVIIGRYPLTSQFSRLCTPRASSNVYLKAKVTNTSNYPLRSGNSSVYLDGSFASSIYISSINPGETFDLSLGQVLSHYRLLPISSLTVIDSIPTTEDIDIFIKLVNPPLRYPEVVAAGFKDLIQARTGIPVTEDIPKLCSVFARWDMVDEPPHDLSMLGANGKMNWVCCIAGKESIDLNLQWQVLVYSGKQIKDF
ncbi:hypothetical protein NP233_g10088 [Leucocoprinus birnbaumii]|uniref:DUF4140 domain-containing protein n=1 Tax=Leucocoprinus birnbaumii TaxID=56174 RepID=A0AAD5YS80_9AGAR|nr:hypothetical protein NP233_g10088 [Leucocoprinus birnbaumii]